MTRISPVVLLILPEREGGGEGGAPVGQRHAVEQAGEGRVDAEAPGAQGPEAVGLAPAPVHRVEVVLERAAAPAPARRQVAVGRRHHEVSAVDDLRAGQRAAGGPGPGDPGGFSVRLGVRVGEVLEVAPSGGRASAVARHCVGTTERPSELSPQQSFRRAGGGSTAAAPSVR